MTSFKPLLLTALISGSMLAGCHPADKTASEDVAATDETVQQAAPAPQTADTDMTLNGLAGSFRDAGAGAPAVLIVPGSGPTDRNGNSPMGIRASSYRLLAKGLQNDGISSLRIDKRGMFGSAVAGDPNAVTVNQYAQDYLGWAEALRERTGVDCVYLLGHSEGGLMVSATAAQNNDGICGLILVAAPGRPLGDVMREQLRSNPANAPVLDDALGAIDQLEAGARLDVSAMHPALQGLFAPVVQDFLISLFAADPADLAARADVPVLVIQGDRDIQVSLTDAQRLTDSTDKARLVVLPGVNHVLKDSPEDRAGNMATYANSDLPLAEAVAPAIVDFIRAQ